MKSFGMTVISLALCVGAILMCDSKMRQMLSLLESSTRKVSMVKQQLPTNVCSFVTANYERKDDSMNYKEALEILRDEQTSWLTILGIFATIFGFLVPAGAYLLQRQSLRDEREKLLKDVEKVNAKLRDLEEVRAAFDGGNKLFWAAMERALEY